MKGTLKHFTVIEVAIDSESPMIGTFDNVVGSGDGVKEFRKRLWNGLGEHFDSEEIQLMGDFPDLFTGSPYEDVYISVDGETYKIRILETWMY